MGSTWGSLGGRIYYRSVESTWKDFSKTQKQAIRNEACWFRRSRDISCRESASIVSWIFRCPHSCDSHDRVDTGVGPRCPLTSFPCPITQLLKVCLDMPFAAPLSPATPFYLPSKEPLYLQVSHFKGAVEWCSNLLCGCQREYVLNFGGMRAFCNESKVFRAWQKFC